MFFEINVCRINSSSTTSIHSVRLSEPIEQTLHFSLSREALEKYVWDNVARLIKI